MCAVCLGPHEGRIWWRAAHALEASLQPLLLGRGLVMVTAQDRWPAAVRSRRVQLVLVSLQQLPVTVTLSHGCDDDKAGCAVQRAKPC